jgi:hypothetical protein
VLAGKATGEALSLPDFGDPQDLAASLAIVLGVVVIAAIVIPLLLFGIELIVLGFVIAAAIFGRGLLGRPWIVEAQPVGASVPTYTWRVRGWRRSARLADEVAAALVRRPGSGAGRGRAGRVDVTGVDPAPSGCRAAATPAGAVGCTAD